MCLSKGWGSPPTPWQEACSRQLSLAAHSSLGQGALPPPEESTASLLLSENKVPLILNSVSPELLGATQA